MYNERRQHDSVKLFEIADVYFSEPFSSKRLLGIIASGRVDKNYEDFSRQIDDKYIKDILSSSITNFDYQFINIPRESLDTKIKNHISYIEIEIDSSLAVNYEIDTKDENRLKIIQYKPIRVAIKGEVRSPGLIKFPSFISTNVKTIMIPSNTEKSNLDSEIFPTISSTKSNILNNSIKRDNDYITTLSNAIQGAGGLTSSSDISKIEIVRDIPIGKGGGKKRAFIDFRDYTRNADNRNDIRLFNGDSIFIPKLKTKDPTIIPSAILSGLSPRFMDVTITGQIENPGNIKIPIEGSLSDLMNLTGPRKPLSGKVFLIRYNKDGTLLRKNIKYKAKAIPGSSQNPYLLSGDLITIKNSIIGRTSGTLSAITQPIVSIYSAKELYKDITGN